MAHRSEFRLVVHSRERILEIEYPDHLTLDAFDLYEREVHAAVKGLGSSWDCLVDQTSFVVVSPEISERITRLNSWARAHGMRRTARVVRESAISELQARRILREIGLEEGASLHHDRDSAWRALTYLSSSSASWAQNT